MDIIGHTTQRCELLKNHVPLDVVTTFIRRGVITNGCELLKNHVPLDVVTTAADVYSVHC